MKIQPRSCVFVLMQMQISTILIPESVWTAKYLHAERSLLSLLVGKHYLHERAIEMDFELFISEINIRSFWMITKSVLS